MPPARRFLFPATRKNANSFCLSPSSGPWWAFVSGFLFTPALFYAQTDDLHALYSFYCQNTPQSEELRRQVGEQNNPFLRQCQTNLGHKLPLSAYLLKPVQRITKYQLLLKVRFG